MSKCCQTGNGGNEGLPSKSECAGDGSQERSDISESSGCCGKSGGEKSGAAGIDWLLLGSGIVVLLGLLLHFLPGGILEGFPAFRRFSHAIASLIGQMWWGVLLGMFALGILSRVPREFVTGILGRGGTWSGIFRATAAGLLLDLCNHGILLVAAGLYRKGASIGQVVAFLVASPWNSLSITLVLIALIGLPWTLAIVFLSMLVALATGRIFDFLVERQILPSNPNTFESPPDFRFWPEAARRLRSTPINPRTVWECARDGFLGSGMIVRWLLFGAVLAALVQTVVSDEVFGDWFGPTAAGLFLTLLAATVIEVCSEGSAPLAAQLFTRAGAPGNGFVFLMAGASTDVTEILVLREATKSWKISLFLPLVTIPQIVFLGWILNRLG